MAVNSFDSGNLSPLFTTSVADPTTDPVLSFDLTAASPYTVYGNNTASSADPDFFTPDLSTALFTGILPIARGGTGAAVGAILNQIASPQTAGFNITGNGTLGGTLAVSTKANIGSPSGTTGALNTNQDGIWSFRNADPNRYIRFNTSGTFNDFLSTGVPLVINYGFAVTAQNVNFFGGSAAHAGIVSIGSNTATNARLNVKGSTTNSSAFSLRLFDSSDVEKFSVRNDGQTTIASLSAGGIVKSTAGALSIATAGTDYLTPTGNGSGLSGVVLTTGIQSIDGAKTFTDGDDGKIILNRPVLTDGSNRVIYNTSGLQKWYLGPGVNTENFQIYNVPGSGPIIDINFTTDITTFAGDIIVPDEVYGIGWNGSLEVPTKNAVYDKIESLGAVFTNTPNTFTNYNKFTIPSSNDNYITLERTANGSGTRNAIFFNSVTTDWVVGQVGDTSDDFAFYYGGNSSLILSASDGSAFFTTNVKAGKYLLNGLNSAPSSSSDTGTTGEIRWTNGYVYLCIATNTWQRAALATW